MGDGHHCMFCVCAAGAPAGLAVPPRLLLSEFHSSGASHHLESPLSILAHVRWVQERTALRAAKVAEYQVRIGAGGAAHDARGH